MSKPELSVPQEKRLMEVTEDALEGTRINEWERNFCADLRARVAEYGTYTKVSAAQWETFEKIEKKVYGT